MELHLQLEIAARLIFAFAIGGLLGYERSQQQKPAGSRTHALVSLAAALFMVISIYGFAGYSGTKDPARLAAQVVTGMGFIGAGTIFKEGSWVRGLTTAATLWTASAMGLAAGAGLYVPALVTVALVYIALEAHSLKRLFTGRDEWIDRQQVIEQLDLGLLKMNLERILAVPMKISTFNGSDPYVVSFSSTHQSDPFTLTIAAKGPVLTLVLLYVPPTWRHKGYARAVVQALLDWAGQNGFSQVSLTSKEEIAGLWPRLGFTREGEYFYVRRLS